MHMLNLETVRLTNPLNLFDNPNCINHYDLCVRPADHEPFKSLQYPSPLRLPI